MVQIAEKLLYYYDFLLKIKITISIGKFYKKQTNSQFWKTCRMTKRNANFCQKCKLAICFKCQYNHVESHDFDYFYRIFDINYLEN